ncbi:hypothetical protein TNCV_4041901 [Trichonephila clavipes]|nr:hypothetical protein TNCV_4041901 [Trichonephila clavipes]
MFVIDYAVEDAIFCDAMTRIATAMVSQSWEFMLLQTPSNCSSDTCCLARTPILDSGIVMWLHDPLRLCGQHACLVVANERWPLRSSMAFRITILNPSIPYSAVNYWIATDVSNSTAI